MTLGEFWLSIRARHRCRDKANSAIATSDSSWHIVNILKMIGGRAVVNRRIAGGRQRGPTLTEPASTSTKQSRPTIGRVASCRERQADCTSASLVRQGLRGTRI